MAVTGETGISSTDTIDFLVIGAPKSGTTSLFEHLRGHPEIDLPPDKEAPYFNDDRIYTKLAWDEYMRWAFPTPKRGRLSGTITPHYMAPITCAPEADDGGGYTSAGYDARALPRRIHERLPSARLIAILRDPVERAYSHHVEITRRGAENRPFATVVDELLQPDTLARCRSRMIAGKGFVVLGEYGRILKGYYDVFPREQILVLFTDDLAREPLDVLRRIYDFLEVSPDYEPPNLGKRYNVAGTELRTQKNVPATMVRVASANPVARAIWHSLSAKRKEMALGAYRRFNFRFWRWNRRGGKPAEQEPPADVSAGLERLRGHYAEDWKVLEGLLDRSLPWGGG
jgi:Sulfotransferase domain